MCGIIALLRRRSRRAPPEVDELQRRIAAVQSLVGTISVPFGSLAPRLVQASAELGSVNAALGGAPGVTCLVRHAAYAVEIDAAAKAMGQRIVEIETQLDSNAAQLGGAALEELNSALVQIKDAIWAVQHDRLRTARAVVDLAGATTGDAALAAFLSVQEALAGLDRLEVRGRDSAGLHVLVTGHDLDLGSSAVRALLARRSADRLFGSMAVRTPGGHLGFVYKAAAEIGELGDNVRALREAIRGDELLHQALQAQDAQAVVLAHTRWASVGIISQANAHPLDQEEIERRDGPYVIAALNGDIDNHAELVGQQGLRFDEEITTDAKLIAPLVSRQLSAGEPLEDAFRGAVASFTGSIAIAAHAADASGRLCLALSGSGQALYVGLAEDAFVVASEPYGLVEQTDVYLRMDGETRAPTGSRGQVVMLDRDAAGTLDGVRRVAFDGSTLPIAPSELSRAQITTRDIDRGAFPHFLLKEISEAPRSFQKTLRGKITRDGELLRVVLGPEAFPEAARTALQEGRIARILVIGQGTAAVAGQGMAALLDEWLRDHDLVVEAMPATELSGFHLRTDMRDTLVIAVSQSGTTTDTNRAVDLVRSRGATVLAIVNRRNSDLTEKAHGVLYTSDGRDIEMSVASTKAFYAQIAAGCLLGFAIAGAVGAGTPAMQHELLTALRELPQAMQQVLALRPRIAAAAARHAPRRRHWALVGNGKNRIAAAEIRIKLSELCYKSIACDATEDKKHIDLSSEPLILVCAAGLEGSTAEDVAKEIAIYRAHKAAPIVITSAGGHAFPAALEVIEVPAVHHSLAFVLATMAGHLFGYHAALAIDALARPLREARAAVEALVEAPGTDDWLQSLAPMLAAPAARFFAALRDGVLDGSLQASTAARLASLLRYAQTQTPLESFQAEHGRAGTPGAVVEELTRALTLGIEELTRPVDAIKHQAKTVTVGTSRSEEALLKAPLVLELAAAGALREQLGWRDLRALAALGPLVAKVTGFTRYALSGDPQGDSATIRIVQRGGVSRRITSRTLHDPRLRGTKHLVARERQLLVAKGASDGRTVVLVPEVEAGRTAGITLLHVQLEERVPATVVRGALAEYRNRYAALRDAVMETEAQLQDEWLELLPVQDLLTQPIHALAERCRALAASAPTQPRVVP